MTKTDDEGKRVCDSCGIEEPSYGLDLYGTLAGDKVWLCSRLIPCSRRELANNGVKLLPHPDNPHPPTKTDDEKCAVCSDLELGGSDYCLCQKDRDTMTKTDDVGRLRDLSTRIDRGESFPFDPPKLSETITRVLDRLEAAEARAADWENRAHIPCCKRMEAAEQALKLADGIVASIDWGEPGWREREAYEAIRKNGENE